MLRTACFQAISSGVSSRYSHLPDCECACVDGQGRIGGLEFAVVDTGGLDDKGLLEAKARCVCLC